MLCHLRSETSGCPNMDVVPLFHLRASVLDLSQVCLSNRIWIVRRFYAQSSHLVAYSLYVTIIWQPQPAITNKWQNNSIAKFRLLFKPHSTHCTFGKVILPDIKNLCLFVRVLWFLNVTVCFFSIIDWVGLHQLT